MATYRCTILRLANIAATFAALGFGQVEITPQDSAYARLVKRFDEDLAAQKERRLVCQVTPVAPRLGFSFRFFAGYFATLPARQLEAGKRNRVAAVFRVTSLSQANATGEAHYFIQPMKLPAVPPNPGRTRLDLGGGFYMGEGAYQVDWLLADQNERVCVKSWKVRTPQTKAAVLVPAGSVRPLGTESWKGLAEKRSATDAKVTVFLSAMPFYRRRSLNKLPTYDLAVLLSTLTSMLDTSKYGHARVICFDLLGKRVLFEQDEFDPEGYKRLRDTLEATNYGTVDYQTLQRGATDRRLLEQLVKEEAARTDKSDAVVFLGAEGPPADRLPPVFNEYRLGLSKLYYAYFQRFQHPAQDVMYQFVHSGKGKTLSLFTPRDLVNAIKVIDSGS